MITIGHLKTADAPQLWKYASNDAVTKYLTWRSYRSKEKLDDYLHASTKKKRFPDEVLGIYSDGTLVGTIHMISRGSNTVQFGYGILEEFWGRGYCTKGATLALERLEKTWLKTSPSIEVWADVHRKNAGGVAIAKKLGFKLLCVNIEENRDRYIRVLLRGAHAK